MNKAEFKEKRKKLLEQRVRPTEGPHGITSSMILMKFSSLVRLSY